MYLVIKLQIQYVQHKLQELLEKQMKLYTILQGYLLVHNIHGYKLI